MAMPMAACVSMSLLMAKGCGQLAHLQSSPHWQFGPHVQLGELHGPAFLAAPLSQHDVVGAGQPAHLQSSPHWQLGPHVQLGELHGPPFLALLQLCAAASAFTASKPTAAAAAMSALDVHSHASPHGQVPPLLALQVQPAQPCVVTRAVCDVSDTETPVTPFTPRSAFSTVPLQPPHVIFVVMER